MREGKYWERKEERMCRVCELAEEGMCGRIVEYRERREIEKMCWSWYRRGRERRRMDKKTSIEEEGKEEGWMKKLEEYRDREAGVGEREEEEDEI